jgi:autotransporter-associated beta strand protein
MLISNLFTSDTALVNNILFGGDFTFNHSTGSFSGTVDLGGATRTISGIGTANPTFSGVVSNGGIIVSGAAGLGLSNVANTFAGGVTIGAGSKLTYTGTSYSGSAGAVTAGTLGTGTLVFENGSALVNSSTNAKVGNNMLANGDFSLNTNNLRFEGAFDLGGANRTITMQGANGVTFAGKISNGGIVIAGTSAAISLTNVENDFAGGVTVGPNNSLNITGNSVGTPGVVTKGPLGTGTLTINGGKIVTNYTSNIYNNTTVGGDFTIVPDASSYFYGDWDLGSSVRSVDVRSEFSGKTLQLGNVIKGSGGLTFTTSTNSSYVSSIVMSGSASNTYTGVTTMNGAASTASLTLNKSGGATAIAGDLTITSGTVKYSSNNNQIADTSKVTVNGASAILDLAANRSDTVGTVVLDGGGSITGTGTSTLTSTGSFDFRSGSVTAILAGSGITLTKTTANSVTLSGANTYTGATTITQGTLVLGTTGSIASSTIGFGVTDSASGLLTAQNTLFAFSGTLTLDLTSVTLTQASWTLFNGSAFGIGDLNLGNVTSNLAALTFVNDGSGNWSGTDASSRTWTFSEDLGTLSVVPEPATWALLGAGVLMLVIVRRRRIV